MCMQMVPVRRRWRHARSLCVITTTLYGGGDTPGVCVSSLLLSREWLKEASVVYIYGACYGGAYRGTSVSIPTEGIPVDYCLRKIQFHRWSASSGDLGQVVGILLTLWQSKDKI